jgi:hypothetical protein
MLKSYYGNVLLKKDTILYHTTDEEFSYKSDKPLLFLIFHPSEWENLHYNVVKIILKKDINLLFMISKFKKHFIFSSINDTFLQKNYTLILGDNNNFNYMSKLSNNEKLNIIDKLEKENFNGWFSSIENKSHIEVALINNYNFYSIISCEKLTRNWRNGNNLNNVLNSKNWGNKYEISPLHLPVIFDVNIRYKKIIEEYIEYGLNSKYPYEYILQVIFKNAIINYHND